MKIAAFLITALVNIAVGVVLFFLLILGLNGFSESEANPGIILFIIWVLITSLVAGFLSLLATRYFVEKKSMNSAVAALLSVLIFIFVGAAASFVGWFASLMLVSALR